MGLLRDNIRFLNDPDLNNDEEEADHPQVFLLSGQGEPGSALEESHYPLKRRQWTCWVAGHRLKSVNTGETETSASGVSRPGRKLIILEFELENDPFNPLYPLHSTPNVSHSKDTSPFQSNPVTETASDAGSASERTEQGEKDNSDDITLNVRNPSVPTLSDVIPLPNETSKVAALSTLVPKSTPEITIQPPADNMVSPSEGYWAPSAEAIIKSTTSRSKPLKSLEKMRYFSRNSTALEHLSGSGAGPTSVGTMDVFTVLQEVNEQIGKAHDLVQLLDIVVGVIKDLTQFHRVMCYQFDDLWNGQVISELVDWSHTRDLFMGLHFPAGDIPAQVSGGLLYLDKI